MFRKLVFTDDQGNGNSSYSKADGKSPLSGGKKQQEKDCRTKEQDNQAAIPFQLSGLPSANRFISCSDGRQDEDGDNGKSNENNGDIWQDPGRDHSCEKPVKQESANCFSKADEMAFRVITAGIAFQHGENQHETDRLRKETGTKTDQQDGSKIQQGGKHDFITVVKLLPILFNDNPV